MPLLKDRVIELKVITQTRVFTLRKEGIGFDVRMSHTKDPNTAKITIVNLSKSTQALFRAEAAAVELSAGHKETIGLIFKGEVVNVINVPKRPETETVIYASDALKSYSETFFDRTYPAGTSMNIIMMDLTAAMGMPSEVDFWAAPEQLQKAKTYSGLASKILQQIASNYGLEWSIQNGTIVVSPEGVGQDKIPAVVISPATGLHRQPEIVETKQVGKRVKLGVRYSVQMNPKLRPGRVFIFEDARPTMNSLSNLNEIPLPKPALGKVFVCDKVQHIGSNFDKQYATMVEADIQQTRRIA